MLKKTTTAVLTAIATMLSAVSPITTFAENAEPVETIPERTVTQELTPYSNAPAVLDDEPVQTSIVSTIATIPDRVYTCTTVPAIEIQPEEFPLARRYDVTVNVVDSKTREHVDGVKVHFVETQNLQSNLITRDYGTWDTSESESYSIDIVHLFTSLSSTITLTAVLEDIPEGYSYLGGKTIVDDFIIDNAMDWYYANCYGNEHQPHTDLTIYLDKEYKGTVQATCLLIDGKTGEYVEGAEVSLSEWDDNGNLGNCVEWVTSGQPDYIDFDYTIPAGNVFSTVQFVVDKLPEKYNKYTYSPFVETYISANSSNPSFVLYLYEDGYDTFNPPDIMTTTDTHTTPPMTTTTTIAEYKACDHCGTLINVNDGITTPLGMFLCSDCKSAGAGGTRPPSYTETVTATTIATTATTTATRECDTCGKYINENDGIITPLGLVVCSDCKSAGAGGTKPQDSEINTNGGKLFYGDSNCDENTNVADAVFIMQCLSNPDEYKISEWGEMNADVCNRGDGVTAMDALVIQMVSINMYSLSDLPVKI